MSLSLDPLNRSLSFSCSPAISLSPAVLPMSRDGPLSHLLRPLRNGLNYKVNTSRARQWRRDYTHASVIEKPGLSILTEHFEGYHPDAEFNDANRANTHEYLRVASGAIPLFALGMCFRFVSFSDAYARAEKLVAVLVKDGYIFYEAKNYGFDETYNWYVFHSYLCLFLTKDPVLTTPIIWSVQRNGLTGSTTKSCPASPNTVSSMRRIGTSDSL